MFRLSGGYGNDILMEDILKIVRKIQPDDVLEFYKRKMDKCPNCGLTRRVVKGQPVISKE
jgi:glutaredoxin-related protein